MESTSPYNNTSNGCFFFTLLLWVLEKKIILCYSFYFCKTSLTSMTRGKTFFEVFCAPEICNFHVVYE
jgi:hypothetical protein